MGCLRCKSEHFLLFACMFTCAGNVQRSCLWHLQETLSHWLFFATFSAVSSAVVNMLHCCFCPSSYQTRSPSDRDSYPHSPRLSSPQQLMELMQSGYDDKRTGSSYLSSWCNDDNLLLAWYFLTGQHDCQNVHLFRHASTEWSGAPRYAGFVCLELLLKRGVDTNKQLITVMQKPQGSRFMSLPCFLTHHALTAVSFLSDKYDRCISSCAVCLGEIRTG